GLVAFIPAGVPRRELALEIRNPGVVSFLTTVFDNMWQRAQPIEFNPTQVRPPHVTDEIEGAILRFLVEGHTDATMARQLALSQRTVATYIKRISDRLGSSSRAQLGYLIAVRGLLID
ncbi:MAG: response regulator transcription factor, partial [Micromonosporaceae bacterium]